MKKLWLIAGTLLGLGMLALTARYVDVGHALQVLRGIDLRFAVLAVLGSLGFLLAKAWRWTLLLNGWREVGTVVGDDRESAERRFFDRYVALETTREMEAALATPPPPPVAQREATDVVGLFPQPGAQTGAPA